MFAMSPYQLGHIRRHLYLSFACLLVSRAEVNGASNTCDANLAGKPFADSVVMLQSVVHTDFDVDTSSPGHVEKRLAAAQVLKNAAADQLLMAGLDHAYLVSGSSRYPSYMGVYTRTTQLHGGREVFIGNGSQYLFFYSDGSIQQWVIGPSLNHSEGYIVSDVEAREPSEDSTWIEWDAQAKTWVSSATTVQHPLDRSRWWKHPKHKPIVTGTKVKFNMAGDLPQFIAGLCFNAMCMLFFIIVFIFFERRYPLVYGFRAIDGGETAEFNEHPAPRRWSVTDKSWVRWLQVSLGTTSEEVEKTSGLDAAMFLQFLEFSMQLMTCLGLPLAFIMIPIYYFKGGGFAKDDRLSWIGVGNVVYNDTFFVNGTELSEEEIKIIPQVQWIYWVLAAAVWFVVVFTQCWVLRHQDSFLKRHLDWRLRMPFPQCTTVLVEGIPRAFASDGALTNFFADKFGAGAIRHAFVLKRLTGSKLHELINEYHEREQRVHEIYFKIAIDPSGRPKLNNGEDELEYLEGVQRTLAATIVDEQQNVKQLAAQADIAPTESITAASVRRGASRKTSTASNSISERIMSFSNEVDDLVEGLFDNQALLATNGFVIFESRKHAEEALGCEFSKNRNEWRMMHPPPPSDVIYRNLEVSDEWKTSQQLWGRVAIVILYFGFMPLVVGISNLTLLFINVPFIVRLLESTGSKQVVENLCSTVGLTVMMSMLPTLLMVIFTSFFPATSGGIGQKWVQQYYFWALILFVLLITAVGVDLPETLGRLITSPHSIFTLLAEKMPGATHFYLTYTAFQSVTLTMNLTRYMNLVKFIIYSRSSSPQRAYELSEPEDQAYYGIGARSARTSLFLATGLVFGTICPLMNFVVFFTFAVCRLVYGYLIPYAETKKNDLGGLHWVKQLEHVNLSLLIYITMMTGILLIQAESKWPAFVAACSFLWWPFPVWELERGMIPTPLKEADINEAESPQLEYEYCQPELEWTPETGKDPCKMHTFGLDDVSFFLAASGVDS